MRIWKVYALLVGTSIVAGAPLPAADGDLDLDFSVDGLRTVGCATGCQAQAAIPAPGGALLVAGWMAAPRRWTVSRLNENGGLDTAWAIVFEPFDFTAAGASTTVDVHDLRLDGSQRLLMAGDAENGSAEPVPALARLTATGALDTTFDSDGRYMLSDSDLPPLGELTQVNDAAILADGSSVFVGACDGCLAAGVGSAFVVRLLPTGALDTSFGEGGWLLFSHPGLFEPIPMAVSVAEGGQITVAGWGETFAFERASFVMRWTAAGEPDTSFGGGDGISSNIAFPPRIARAMAIDADTGAIVLATVDESATAAGGSLIGLTPDGDVDAAFGAGGILDLDLEEGARLNAVSFQNDGRIVAVGSIDATGAQESGFFLVRALAGGALDATFDGNGVKRVEFDLVANARDRGLAMTFSGGRLIAAGLARDAAGDDLLAILRTENAAIFSDGFERGTAAAWAGE